MKQLNEEPELQTAVVEKIRDQKLNSDDTGNLVKALKKHPEKSKEILDSPSDHLVKFFQDAGDPLANAVGDMELNSGPVRISPQAQRIMDFCRLCPAWNCRACRILSYATCRTPSPR